MDLAVLLSQEATASHQNTYGPTSKTTKIIYKTVKFGLEYLNFPYNSRSCDEKMVFCYLTKIVTAANQVNSNKLDKFDIKIGLTQRNFSELVLGYSPGPILNIIFIFLCCSTLPKHVGFQRRNMIRPKANRSLIIYYICHVQRL